MALTPEQQQELADLRRIDHLTTQVGEGKPQLSDPNSPQNKYRQALSMTEPDVAKMQDLPGAMAGSVPMGKVGELLGKAGSFVAEKTGLNRIPAALIQSATNVIKPSYEVGKQLLEEGIYGTRGQMGKQIGKSLTKSGNDLMSAAASIKNVSSEPIARSFEQQAQDLSVNGNIPDALKSKYDALMRRSRDIASRGNLSGEEALQYKRLAQKEHGDLFKEGTNEPLSGLKKDMARDEAAGFGKQMTESEMAESGTTGVADANKSLHALLQARSGINQASQKVTDPLELLKSYLRKGIGPAAGYAVGGIPGAVGGAAMTTPLVKSTSAQLLYGAPKVAPEVLARQQLSDYLTRNSSEK